LGCTLRIRNDQTMAATDAHLSEPQAFGSWLEVGLKTDEAHDGAGELRQSAPSNDEARQLDEAKSLVIAFLEVSRDRLG
jgi:hypothetical protein